MTPSEPTPFAVAAAGMGQNLFSPPNVKGWPGQETWINTSTLLARKQFLERLFRGDDPSRMAALPRDVAQDMNMAANPPRQALQPQGALDPEKARQIRFMRAMERGLQSVQFDSATWMSQVSSAPDSARRAADAERVLLATAPQAPSDARDDSLALVRGLVLDAAYQLK